MPFSAPPNRAYGSLGSIYTSGGATLTLGSGQGTRFGALAAGAFFWVLIEDKNETKYARFMIAKVTAIAGDSLSITPAEEGTANSNFPMTAGNSLQKVQVTAAHSILQLKAIMDGAGAIIQATAPTLTKDSPRNLFLTPAAPITVVLPTTGVYAGKKFLIANRGSAANTITVNASGGTTVAVIPGGQNMEIVAYQDIPTTNADWGPPSMVLPSVLMKGGAALATPPAGYGQLGALSTDGFGVAKSAPYLLNEMGMRWEFGGGAAKNAAPLGIDIAQSYSSGTGTVLAGVGAAGSVVFATLIAGSLNAVGRRYRILLQLKNNGVADNVTIYFGPNGTTADTAIFGPGSIGNGTAELDILICYLTSTTYNAFVYSGVSGLLISTLNQTINTAGTFAGILKFTAGQAAAVGGQDTYFDVLPQIIG